MDNKQFIIELVKIVSFTFCSVLLIYVFFQLGQSAVEKMENVYCFDPSTLNWLVDIFFFIVYT